MKMERNLGMSNRDQQKETEMLRFLREIREMKSDDPLAAETIAEIERALTEKKYGLVYEKHTEPFYQKIKKQTPVFTEVKERSFCFNPEDEYNLLLEGDNLHSLKLLEQTHKETIDAIYVDFPYNTESKGFKYRDEYIDKSDKFRHSKWLSFVGERVRAAANLLKKDGCIMMSINENELFVLKLLCDEIFGEDNYLTTLTVKVRHEDRILKGDKDFHEVTEFLLFYRKSPAFKIKKRQQDNTSFRDYNVKITELTEHPREELMDGKRVQIFEPGQYKVEKIPECAEGLKKISVRGSLKEGNSSGRFFMKHLNERMQTEQGCLYKVENMGLDGLGYRYFRIPDAAERRINGDYYQGVPQNRSEVKYVPYPNYVDFEEAFNYVGYEGGVEFRNGKKPCAFLKHCLNLAGIYEKKDAWILDFFAGSASTGEAVAQMNAEDGGNRHFILCTNNEVGPQKEEEFRKRIGKTPKEFAEYLKYPDERWEEFVKENGICASIAYPRLKNVANGYTYALQRRQVHVEGIPFNLKYYKADFIPKKDGKITN